MSQVRPDQQYEQQRSMGNGRRVVAMGTTEARPGIMTTEFWLIVLSAIGLVVAAYISDTFTNDLGWALAAGLIAAYALSRGLAKCGSREGPFFIGDRSER
jgi:hypothetical protein